jgi:DNA-directed RNA polymerase subunit K/omega
MNMTVDYKKSKAPVTTITRDTDKLETDTGNIYETVVIVSKRANQISVEIKQELNRKLEEFAYYTDNLEEVFENREQIEISKFYERLPKPTLIALQEFTEGQVYFRRAE